MGCNLWVCFVKRFVEVGIWLICQEGCWGW